MNGCGKSDSPIVLVKSSNKCCGALQCAERVEESEYLQYRHQAFKKSAKFMRNSEGIPLKRGGIIR